MSSMSPKQVLEYFKAKNVSDLAVKLHKPASTVHEWFQRDRVPRAVQYELQIATGGKLRANVQ